MRAARSPFTVALLAGALVGCSSSDTAHRQRRLGDSWARLLDGCATPNRDHRGAAVQRSAGAGA